MLLNKFIIYTSFSEFSFTIRRTGMSTPCLNCVRSQFSSDHERSLSRANFLKPVKCKILKEVQLEGRPTLKHGYIGLRGIIGRIGFTEDGKLKFKLSDAEVYWNKIAQKEVTTRGGGISDRVSH